MLQLNVNHFWSLLNFYAAAEPSLPETNEMVEKPHYDTII